MAAYASLLSLGHILDQLLQHPPRQMAVLDKAQIHSLLDIITFLQDFLEEFSMTRGDEIQALEEKMASSAYAAEVIIERLVLVQILEDSDAGSEISSSLCSQDLPKVIEEIGSVKEDVMEIKETEGIKIIEQPRKAATAGSSTLDESDRHFLDMVRSGGLLGVKVFGEESCYPPELEEVGKTIVRNCGGLPLASVAISGLLAKSSRTVEDQILEDSEGGSERSSTLFCQDLQKVIEEMASMKKDVMKIKETEGIQIMEQPRKAATSGSFPRGASDNKNTTVGFTDDLNQIMDTLTGDESNLQILSIVGMGGIGKTTLAKNVFDNPLIVHRFERRAWVTISQEYSVHEILSGLLKEILGEEIAQEEDDELGLHIHRSLFDRRYLIVMDDIWSIEVWDYIKRFLPDNSNGSRVLVTTRLSKVADSFCSCTPQELHLLDYDKSWTLFHDKVFGKESFPPELEKVGKTIVRNCGGLPLAIVAISGLLAKSSRTVEYWEHVANDTYAALNMGGDDLCCDILSLSYKHLPVHLKPCFLYMATFPEDHKIKISRLVKLWVAEGMLKPMDSKSLEEVAEDNLKDLIDRNLIMIDRYGSRNQINTCTIHDLLRDLCLKEAGKEKFLCVTMKHSLNVTSRIHEDELNFTFAKLRRVLKRDYICSNEEIEIVRLVNSRYIYFKPIYSHMFENLLNSLESLSLLWNLQTITIDGDLHLPDEIWEMPQLRHLKTGGGNFYLPDPPSNNSENGRGDIIVLKNREFSDGFGWDYHEVYNLSKLHNLESLFLDCDEKNVLRNVCFPRSLKKLTLKSCGVCWEDVTVVGSLPHLEVLNLMYEAVKGREWNPVEGQFLELKSLRIKFANLVEWIADSSHFPRLEKLELQYLRLLKEIPQGIGEIPTLRKISLVFCSESANSSAKKIQEEQQNLGNLDLQISINCR